MQTSAQHLSRTPSAVSKSLSELEAIVGARLFERTRRGLVPTPAAQRLLVQVRRGLGLVGAAIDQAAGRAAPAGAPTVTLGVLPTASSTVAPPAVLQMQRSHPGTLVRVVEGTNLNLLDRLRQRALDVVIGRLAAPSLMFDLAFEPLYEEPLIVVVAHGHPLAGARHLTLAALAEHLLVLPDAGTVLRDTLDPTLLGAGVGRPARTIETVSVAMGRELVAAGAALWFCAPGVVAHDLQAGRFVALDVDLAATRRAVGLTVRADEPLSPEAVALTDLLRAEARRRRGRAGGRRVSADRA